jgi:hypothetical protein
MANGSPPTTPTLPGDLAEFLETGIAAIVGSTDGENRPSMTHAWGLRLAPDSRTLAFFVEAVRSKTLLANVTTNGRLAVTFANPVSYRSIQLKGRCIDTRPATPDDERWIEAQFARFVASTALVGDPPELMQRMMSGGPFRRFDMTIDSSFDQTPGPDAGRAL